MGGAARARRASSAAPARSGPGPGPGISRPRRARWPSRAGRVEADDVADLVDEQRVGGQLEGLGAVRLQPEGAPDPAHRRAAHPEWAAIEARDQCVASRGVVLERVGDHPLDLLVGDLSAGRRGGVRRPARRAGRPRTAPATCPPWPGHPQLRGHLGVGGPVRAGQHDPRPQRQRWELVGRRAHRVSVSRSSSLSVRSAMGRPRRAIPRLSRTRPLSCGNTPDNPQHS